MSIRDVMLEQLAVARRIVTDGHEVVPAWRIETPDGGAWLILTRFDPNKPGQSDRALHLIKRFMVWKLAHAFVLAAETWLGPVVTRRGGEEAVTAVGVSRADRLGVIQRIRRKGDDLRRERRAAGAEAELTPACRRWRTKLSRQGVVRDAHWADGTVDC